MAGWIDAKHYNLEIWLDPPKTDFKATLTLSVQLLKPVDQFNLNLEGLTLDTLYCRSTPLSYAHDGNAIRIQFKRRMSKNKNLDLVIRYHGTPTDGLIIRNQSGNFTAFADNWASRARNWLPSIDHPGDKATFSSTVHVPSGYEVIGNGTKFIDQVDQGWRTAVYRIDQPISTYCMVIGVSQFSMHRTTSARGIPLWYYTYPRDSALALGHFTRVPDMVDFYDSLIGPYSYTQLALVQSSTKFGGMENSSAIFLGENSGVYRNKTDPEGLLAHEIAHQWFGDAVTESSWSELWLSEGFATYFSALYFESRDGKMKFDSILQQTRKTYLKTSDQKFPVIYNGYPHLNQLLNSENYQKGGLFLHALRIRVGDLAFFEGIRKYYNRYKDHNATTIDFRNQMERSSGQKLGVFFSKWLHQPGLPPDEK